MRLLRLQPNHKSVWTIQRHLCLRGTKGALSGPPGLETTIITPSLAWGFPHPHLGSCPHPLPLGNTPSRKHHLLTTGEQRAHREMGQNSK